MANYTNETAVLSTWTPLWLGLQTMCSRPLTKYDRPSALEWLMPPSILIFLMFIGLSHQYVTEVVKRRQRKETAAYLNRKGVVLEKHELDGSLSGDNVINILLEEEEFMTPFDTEVLTEMQWNVNNLRELFAIAIPALGSLFLSGTAVMFSGPLLNCMWPAIQRPDINTCIACYLAPAGLVYALSFGFMFQQALEKHNNAVNKVTSELSLLDQLVTLAAKLNLPTRRHLMALCKAVKAEAVCMAMLVQKRQPESFKNPAPPNNKVQLWTIIDILRDTTKHPETPFRLNFTLARTMIDYIVKLNNICTDRMGAMQVRIHPLKWAFLEVLGVMTLYGIMLVVASSPRFENTIMNLTLYSVSMLCYVLADLDSPFDGFFRVDMTVLHEVVMRAEVVYNSARDGGDINLAYVQIYGDDILSRKFD